MVLLFAAMMAASIGPAAAQISNDAPGVTVMLNGSTILHRTPVPYPNAVGQKGVQGTVIIEVGLDAKGNVSDARVLSGPAELRRTSIESVLQWHFTQDAANSTRQVTVQFELPQTGRGPRGPDFNPALVVLQPAPAGPLGKRIHNIDIQSIPEDARNQLMSRLPAHVGDVLSQDLAEAITRAAQEFDEHLRVGFMSTSDNEISVQIVLPGYGSDLLPRTPSAPRPVRISAALLQGRLKSAPAPEYPALARQARIQGMVRLDAVVNKDGNVQNLSVISGHPLLVPAAVDAVKRWTYDPTVLNGKPTEVQAEVAVTFALAPE